MNPETVLAEVGQKMLMAAIGSTDSVRVCWLGGEFICLNSSDRRDPELVIARFRPDKIVSGLSSLEWERLSEKLQSTLRIKT